MFTFLVPTSGNETTSYKDCSVDEGILNGSSTTRTHVNYSCLSTTNGKLSNYYVYHGVRNATDLLHFYILYFFQKIVGLQYS